MWGWQATWFDRDCWGESLEMVAEATNKFVHCYAQKTRRQQDIHHVQKRVWTEYTVVVYIHTYSCLQPCTSQQIIRGKPSAGSKTVKRNPPGPICNTLHDSHQNPKCMMQFNCMHKSRKIHTIKWSLNLLLLTSKKSCPLSPKEKKRSEWHLGCYISPFPFSDLWICQRFAIFISLPNPLSRAD